MTTPLQENRHATQGVGGTGVRDIGGADPAGLLDWDTYRLTPAGRDLLAYVFAKDARGW